MLSVLAAEKASGRGTRQAPPDVLPMLPPPVSCQPWLGLAIVSYVVCAVALSMHGFLRRSAPASESRRETIVGWMRAELAALEPGLERLGLSPLALTYSQLGVSALAGLAYAWDAIFIGGWCVLVSGILDLLDGSLARRTGRVSRRGAFLDSVSDRYAECVTFVGLGIFFGTAWMVFVVAFGLFGSFMVSYTRARAEGLGVECGGGLMQRGERYVLLSLSSFLSVAANHLLCSPSHVVLIASLVFMAVATNLTAVSRARSVSSALRDEDRR